MELNTIFSIIEDAYFEKWFGDIAKVDNGKNLATMLKNAKTLKNNLTNENKEIFEQYDCATTRYYEIRLYEICSKVLNEGIKIGIDIQKIISEI